MNCLVICLFIFSACSLPTFSDYDEYYNESSDDYISIDDLEFYGKDISTLPTPIVKKGGPNDIRIDKIPLCSNDPDNVGCGSVYVNIKDLQNREKIYLDDVRILYLDYVTEENGIHSLVYYGKGEITAYFTYSGNSVVGTINLKDGKIQKIMSISEQKQISSLIDVPHSIKTEDDEDEEENDPQGDTKYASLNKHEKQLIKNGETDTNSIVKLSVMVYYNENVNRQLMDVKPEVYIRDLLNMVNYGYIKSKVPIKLILHDFEKAESENVADAGLSKACNQALEELKSLKYGWEIMDEVEKTKKCQRTFLAEFRKIKGSGRAKSLSDRLRREANVAVLLVHEIPGSPNFCGRASNVYDIGKTKMNLAVVSIASACEFTFGHELGHLLGLSHQKRGKEFNEYFSYGHGYEIPSLDDQKGTRTVMAISNNEFNRRMNVYSNPREGTGTFDTADNARVLRETRFLAANRNNANSYDVRYTIEFLQDVCQKSSKCLDMALCPDLMTPKNFLHKICGEGEVCCQKSAECVAKFPEIEHKKNGWFSIGNRQDNRTLTVGEKKEDGIFSGVVNGRKEGNKKQTWKWEGDLLVSQWNTDYVFDGSVSPYTVQRRSGSKYQNWRFSDGALVNLGWCSGTHFKGGMSIASKWFRVDTEKQSNTNEDHGPRVSINTYLCKKDESCIDIAHCYEAVPVNTMKTKFCDKGRVCCKNKVCHDVAKFEEVEAQIQGWFVIESHMNKNLLTVKDNTASDRQQVVNSRPGLSMFGQVWSWKEEYIVSKLDKTFSLDGAFGKVSLNKKARGNIFQKWRQSGEFLINAGHCEVLDVAHANTDNDALVTIWSVHDKSHQKWTMKPVKFKQGHWKLV